MDTISVKGETYIKGSKIAKELGYTADYVGQLCRGGLVQGTLVGRSWYVSEKSIRAHKKTRYRSNQTKALNEVRRMVSDIQKPERPLYSEKFAAAVYVEDHEPLLPIVSKNQLQTPNLSEKKPFVEPINEVKAQADTVRIRDVSIGNIPLRTELENSTQHPRPMIRHITASDNQVVEKTPIPKPFTANNELVADPNPSVGLAFSSALIAMGMPLALLFVGLEQHLFVSSILPPDHYYHFDLEYGLRAAVQLSVERFQIPPSRHLLRIF